MSSSLIIERFSLIFIIQMHGFAKLLLALLLLHFSLLILRTDSLNPSTSRIVANFPEANILRRDGESRGILELNQNLPPVITIDPPGANFNVEVHR